MSKRNSRKKRLTRLERSQEAHLRLRSKRNGKTDKKSRIIWHYHNECFVLQHNQGRVYKN